jgi:programmed cell death protein 5
MDPNNMQEVDASEIPDGFSAADPSGGGEGKDKQPTNAERQAQVDGILQQICDSAAFERLKRIKIVRKDKAQNIEMMLVQAAQQGKLPGKITEARLIEMLEQMDGDKGNGPKLAFARKNYGIDSDDDDNDDDLM